MDLLRTKLSPPRLQDDIIQRLDLIKALDHKRTKKLTLVCAPAGYGKSSLVSEWLKYSSASSAWVSLDEEDDHPRHFLRYLSAAIQKVIPGTNLNSSAIAEALDLPAVPTLARIIVNDFERVSRPFLLVLDDFHLIKNQTIYDLINLLLKHQPANMHLVLISREVPPLALPALRVNNEVNEIRINDLSFSIGEVRTFLEKGLKKSINLQMAEYWHAKTEGWVAGLRLALYAIQNRPENAFRAEDDLWDPDYIQQYLVNEVLAQQPSAERSFMEAISILDRFESSLCAHVWSTFDSERRQIQSGHNMFNSMISGDLFLIQLDESHEWFRFHHLFKDLLLKELAKHRSAEMIARLHARASEWLADNGYISEALNHKLKANDIDGAVQLLEKERYSLLDQHQHHILAKWLSLFTPETINQRRELMMTQAWVYYFDGRYQFISPLLDKIESMTGGLKINTVFEGEISLLRGAMSYWAGESNVSLDFIERSLTLIPESVHFARGLAEFYLSLAGLMAGEKARVFKLLYGQMQNTEIHPLRRFRLQMGVIFSHLLAGELLELLSLGQQYLQLIADWRLPNLKAQALYAMGRACYQRNELSSAINYFLQADEISYNLTQNLHTDLLAGLAICYQASGDHKNALHHLDRLFEYVSSHDNPAPLKIVDSCRAHIELIATGETQWKGMRDSSSNAIAMQPVWSNSVGIESPPITEFRALNALNHHKELIMAEQKIGHFLELCESHHNVEKQIEVKALNAVVLLKLGHTEEAFRSLEKAVQLAEPGGYVRPFLESGSTMMNMLKQLRNNEFCADACKRLLDNFAAQNSRIETPDSHTGHPCDWRQILSTREYEILLFLEQRMNNQQIADTLYISKETVRFHLKNIYRKLKVSKRNQAVMAAKKIGIVS